MKAGKVEVWALQVSSGLHVGILSTKLPSLEIFKRPKPSVRHVSRHQVRSAALPDSGSWKILVVFWGIACIAPALLLTASCGVTVLLLCAVTLFLVCAVMFFFLCCYLALSCVDNIFKYIETFI